MVNLGATVQPEYIGRAAFPSSIAVVITAVFLMGQNFR